MPVSNACQRQRKKDSRITEVQLKNRGLANALEKEREINSRLRDEIILLKQRDLKHYEDLSTCKYIITSLASKIQVLASEACAIAEQASDDSGMSAGDEHNPSNHRAKTSHKPPHQQYQNTSASQQSTADFQTRIQAIDTVQTKMHVTPISRPCSYPRRLRSQSWRASSIFPVRRLSDPKVNPRILPVLSHPSSPKAVGSLEKNTTLSPYDLHIPVAPFEGDTPDVQSSKIAGVLLSDHSSPNMPTVDEGEAAFGDIENQIQKHASTNTQASLISNRSSPADDQENHTAKREISSANVFHTNGRGSHSQTLSDITNLTKRRLTRASTSLPRLDQTDRQRAYNMQRVLEGVAGVSVIPETRESKFKTASRSRLRSPNMTRRYCDMPSDAVNSVTASGCNSCTFEETRSVRKSTRQCLSKAVSYKEESLNSKKRREDTCGTDPFFLDTWKGKLTRDDVTRIKRSAKKA